MPPIRIDTCLASFAQAGEKTYLVHVHARLQHACSSPVQSKLEKVLEKAIRLNLKFLPFSGCARLRAGPPVQWTARLCVRALSRSSTFLNFKVLNGMSLIHNDFL